MDLTTVDVLVPAMSAATSLTAFRDGDAWLAGGTWLFSEPQPAVRRLHDLTSLGWEPLTEVDGGLRVAATCTIEQISAWGSAAERRGGPHRSVGALVGQCCDAFLAGWKVQGVATVGGNVVTALPAAPMVSLLAALDATAELWAPGGSRRELAVAELVVADHATALAPGELVRELRVPAPSLAARTAFRRATLTPLGRSASLVVARLDADGSLVVTVTAAVQAPLHLRWPTLAAAGAPPDVAAALDAVVDGTTPRRTWHDDVHGHPAWRRAMALRQAGEVVAELAALGDPDPDPDPDRDQRGSGS